MDSIQKNIKPGFFKSQLDDLLPFVFCLKYIEWETNKVGKRTINVNTFALYKLLFIIINKKGKVKYKCSEKLILSSSLYFLP